MSRIEQKFTPIHEVDGKATEVTRRRFGSTQVIVDFRGLPRFEESGRDILREGIGLNLRAVGRRAKISNFDTVKIQTQTGETTTSSPPIVGINPDGSAIRGLVSRKTRVATGTAEPKGRDLHITLNTSEMKRRLEERNIPLRSQAGWAAEMNRAIELAFMKNQLASMKNPVNLIPEALVVVGGLALFYKKGWGEALNTALFMELLFNAGSYVADKKRGGVPSGVQSFPLERTLASLGTSGKDFILGTQSVVRALPQK